MQREMEQNLRRIMENSKTDKEDIRKEKQNWNR